MARFKVLAGTFTGPDMSQPVGENGKRPSKTTQPGGVVESDVDLVAKHGANKFRRLADKKAPVAPATSAASDEEE